MGDRGVAAIVRPAGPDDLPRCAEIYAAARRVAFHWLPPETMTRDDFARDTAGEEVTVAVSDGPDHPGLIVGFAAAWRPDRFIHHLYVDPAWRRHGIGSLLLAHVAAALAPPVRLKCVVANTPAVAFYRKHDWTEERRGEDSLGPYILFRRR